MANKDMVVWGIHAGSTGDAHTLFFKQNCVALGWNKMGDLGKLAKSREAFKEQFLKSYPDLKATSAPVSAGQMFRFVHEMQVGDLVVYPSKTDRQMHIGRVTGTYVYDNSSEASYPHRRSVEWLKSFPRTNFTQGALYETGSAMSLFQIKNYADEFISASESKSTASVSVADDNKTLALVADEIEQTTRDFILKQLFKDLKGHPFADFVAHILQKMGYKTRVSPPGTDGGIDIIAHKDDLGFEPPIIKVQVKTTNGSIGSPEVQALYGTLSGSNEYGLFVSLSSFTKQAIQFARGKHNLRLIDGNELVEVMLQYYEDFDARYKGLIPLKRVYIPQSLDESDS